MIVLSWEAIQKCVLDFIYLFHLHSLPLPHIFSSPPLVHSAFPLGFMEFLQKLAHAAVAREMLFLSRFMLIHGLVVFLLLVVFFVFWGFFFAFNNVCMSGDSQKHEASH